MIIELHMIQNFAPSCLNRDDTNSPKDCMFGGVRRARISSQCIKRAIRTYAQASFPKLQGHFAIRTKRLMDEFSKLLSCSGRSEEDIKKACKFILGIMGLEVKDDNKTQYLIFLGESEIRALADQINENWDVLITMKPQEKSDDGKKKSKKVSYDNIPPGLKKAIESILKRNQSADVALFGRMITDLPVNNIEAACQVAHAISTHKVDMEMDYYVAIDDLKPDDTSGADMIGNVEFNSACFYRYANINWEALVKNLGNDRELAAHSVEAFLRASIEAIPTGKQNTFAAQNPPSFILAVVRDGGAPWSLANAFEKPVWTNGRGWIEESIKRLDQYWGRLSNMFGVQTVTLAWVSDTVETLQSLNSPVPDVNTLVNSVLSRIEQ